jgi:hypothetical protein
MNRAKDLKDLLLIPGWGGGGGGLDQNCKMCGDIENTEHLIFKWPEYCGLLWEMSYEIGNIMIRKDGV